MRGLIILGAVYDFYSRPCGRGDPDNGAENRKRRISTHAPAGGATLLQLRLWLRVTVFLLTPLREGRLDLRPDAGADDIDFYSRPCGRGDEDAGAVCHAADHFYSRPCGRGDLGFFLWLHPVSQFYSRPCGRGDARQIKEKGTEK